MIKKSISLYFSEGGSNKEYHANITGADGGFSVEFRYGRRGSTLTCGKKNSSPVSFEAAVKIFDKLVKEKVGKGYTEDVGGAVYQSTPDKEYSGIRLELLESLENIDIEKYINDDEYGFQEKMDGERRAIFKNGDSVIGINRRGFIVPLPINLVNSINNIRVNSFLIDGEIIGDKYYAFDLLQLNGVSIKDEGYLVRINQLSLLLNEKSNPHELSSISLVKLIVGADNKRAAYKLLRNELAEGVVIKHLYNNVVQIKDKFVDDCSVIVMLINDGKRSVQVGVYENGEGYGEIVSVGNVTIPPNKDVPNVDSIIDVQYLYYFENGSLFQPVYKGLRLDLEKTDCNKTKLKRKRENDDVSLAA